MYRSEISRHNDSRVIRITVKNFVNKTIKLMKRQQWNGKLTSNQVTNYRKALECGHNEYLPSVRNIVNKKWFRTGVEEGRGFGERESASTALVVAAADNGTTSSVSTTTALPSTSRKSTYRSRSPIQSYSNPIAYWEREGAGQYGARGFVLRDNRVRPGRNVRQHHYNTHLSIFYFYTKRNVTMSWR